MRQLAPGQDADRSAHRRQQRHLQELRALPVDGDERLQGVVAAWKRRGEISVDEPVRSQALGCIDRMLDFVAAQPAAATQATRVSCRTSAPPEETQACSISTKRWQARARNIRDALIEDIGRGDWTGQLVPAGQRVSARVRCARAAVLCGRDWFDGCVHALDAHARIDWHVDEGAEMAADTLVCHIEANARACSRPSARR
jgi:hypothetical protein